MTCVYYLVYYICIIGAWFTCVIYQTAPNLYYRCCTHAILVWHIVCVVKQHDDDDDDYDDYGNDDDDDDDDDDDYDDEDEVGNEDNIHWCTSDSTIWAV